MTGVLSFWAPYSLLSRLETSRLRLASSALTVGPSLAWSPPCQLM